MVDPMESGVVTTDPGDGVETDGAARLPVRSMLPSWRGTVAWLVLTGLATALDGWTGLIVSVGIAAALLAGARSRSLAAAGVVCAALVPVWVLSSGSITAEDVTPALVTESLIPHHLAFAALVLLVVSVVLQASSASDPVDAEFTHVAEAGPFGSAGRALRWATVGVSVVLALVVCVVAWQT